jgi:hypothetical protein
MISAIIFVIGYPYRYFIIVGMLKHAWLGLRFNKIFKNGFLAAWSGKVLLFEAAFPGSIAIFEGFAPFLVLALFNTGALHLFDFDQASLMGASEKLTSFLEKSYSSLFPHQVSVDNLKWLENHDIIGPKKGQATNWDCFQLWGHFKFTEVHHFPPYCHDFAKEFIPQMKTWVENLDVSAQDLENPGPAPLVEGPTPPDKPDASWLMLVLLVVVGVATIVLVGHNI